MTWSVSRIIRRQTLAKYLDATNFEEGNPSADPAEHFPDEVWFIERKIGEASRWSSSS